LANRMGQLFNGLGGGTMILISGIIGGIVGGFGASKGDSLALLAGLGLLCGVVVVVDYFLLMAVTLFGGLVVSGVAQLYFPQLELVRWAFGVSAFVLIGHIFIVAVKNQRLNLRVDSAVMFWALMFIAVLCCSAYMQQVKLPVMLVSIKGYLQVWGLLFALALLPWKQNQINKLPLFFLIVALIQAPFALHQYFVLVPIREGMSHLKGMVPIDIISGTFGGEIDGGGANAALSLMCFIVGGGLLSFWKSNLITTPKFLVLIGLVAFPAFINSTKISMFYLFVILLFIYRDEILAHPLKFIMRSFVAVFLCAVIAYSVISSLPEGAQVDSFSDLYQQTYKYNVADDNIHDDNLSRSGAVTAWFDPVKPHTFKEVIIGYGIGSSRILESEAGQRISGVINIDRPTGVTALAAILWETGLAGLIVVTMMFVSAFSVATRLHWQYRRFDYHRCIFSALQCGLVIMFLSLGHKSFFTFHIGFQTMFAAVFGYLIYWERRSQETRVD